jgi:hypothetical protein
MKAPNHKLVATSQSPVFQKVIHKPEPISKVINPSLKPPEHKRIFPKSHDTREDRGTRKMKTLLNSQTLFRVCALL